MWENTWEHSKIILLSSRKPKSFTVLVPVVTLLQLVMHISRFMQCAIEDRIIGQMYKLCKEVEIFQMIFFNGATLSGLFGGLLNHNRTFSGMEKYLLKFFTISRESDTLNDYLWLKQYKMLNPNWLPCPKFLCITGQNLCLEPLGVNLLQYI